MDECSEEGGEGEEWERMEATYEEGQIEEDRVKIEGGGGKGEEESTGLRRREGGD